MFHMKDRGRVGGSVLIVMLVAGWAEAQRLRSSARPPAANVIVPQSRAFAFGRNGAVRITDMTAGVVILEQMATTTMDISLHNPGRSRQQAELVMPVPDGAVVRGFTFQGAGSEPTAQVLPKDEAKRTYDAIVAKVRDPALLEFTGYNLIRSSVFPVPPRGTQKVRLTYEHLLGADGDRIDYVLPRSENLAYSVPWTISVKIKSKRPISTVYSPSHALETKRLGANAVSVRIAPHAKTEPGAFQLSYLLERQGVTASLLAYPDPTVGGGYFLLLAGLPARPTATAPVIKREVTLVLDRSGSMNGEKLEQVRQAALQVLAGLDEGEAFNVFVYNEAVDAFAGRPVIKTADSIKAARAYLKGVNARGGTNIHDALLEALRQAPVPGTLPIVLFLTDGLPTMGQTSEAAIRNVAIKANPHHRRVFTFGVGVDVNTPLLERIANETRATATFVLPKEDVEVKVAQVFKRLSGPVLADTNLHVVNAYGAPALGRTRDLIPAKLPDLFEGDQLVLTGQYIGTEPLSFKLSGDYLGQQRTFRFTFGLDKATTRNAFVPRLWASRKIGVLVDAIRQHGADWSVDPRRAKAGTDPRTRELVTEVVSLSKQFGILTEYTAFLAREGTDLSRRDEVLAEAGRNFVHRAMRTRSGLGSVNQSTNNVILMNQAQTNRFNAYWDQNMNRVSVTTVQQVNDLAFYRRGNQWIDSRIIDRPTQAGPRKVVRFGSQEFRELAARLASSGRQGSISLRGDILMVVDGQTILVKGPAGR